MLAFKYELLQKYQNILIKNQYTHSLRFRKTRDRDVSKFHTQLSLALLGMLLVFVIGIDRTEVLGGCVFVSVLIHYFTLSAMMWMGAEAVLMFQKLVRVFVQTTTRQIVIISLICWCKLLICLGKLILASYSFNIFKKHNSYFINSMLLLSIFSGSYSPSSCPTLH